MKTTYPAPVENVLDGITTESAARKKLKLARTNVDDDSMHMYASVDDTMASGISLGWMDPSNATKLNRFDMQATDGVGVYLHKCVDGSWTTVPQAISVGGTGVTGIVEKDLTYNGISFIAHKWGPVVTITSTTGTTTNAMSANVPIGTLPAGYRPKVMIDVLNTATETQERWVIDTSGHIQPTVAVGKGAYVRFTATYLTY